MQHTETGRRKGSISSLGGKGMRLHLSTKIIKGEKKNSSTKKKKKTSFEKNVMVLRFGSGGKKRRETKIFLNKGEGKRRVSLGGKGERAVTTDKKKNEGLFPSRKGERKKANITTLQERKPCRPGTPSLGRRVSQKRGRGGLSQRKTGRIPHRPTEDKKQRKRKRSP